jgi:diaminopimelate decarboxylase
MTEIEQLRFLEPEQVAAIAAEFGTPTFVYDEASLVGQAEKALSFAAPYGLTVRYAMKANPAAAILKLFHQHGLHVDASSGFEAERALRAGIPPQNIMLTSQELAHNLRQLVEAGVQFNATSLHQLEEYGKAFPGRDVSVRINPGLGSGGTNRTNTGGPASSFGIWHEYIDLVQELAGKYHLKITKIHTHIGSGSDPEVWQKVAGMSLAIVEQFPDAQTINLGGGYKVGRMDGETSADMTEISQPVRDLIIMFNNKTGRQLHLEIEPGTFMVANAGALITRIHDMTDTGKSGHQFLKIDAGMTEVTRPIMYGSQHPLVVVGSGSGSHGRYVVAGHCCESGDILTPQPGDPEGIDARLLAPANIGDWLVVEGVGAYCSSMNVSGYNSFPRAAELMLGLDAKPRLIRRRGGLDELLAGEI